MQLKTSLQTPGQILKSARESKNISIADVSQRLLLSKQILMAIEADDYSKIYAKVYAEGYLKAYANFLQLPPSQLIESFRSLNIYPEFDLDVPAESTTTCCFNLPCVFADKRIRLGVIISLVLLVLVISVVFIMRASKSDQVSAAVEAAANGVDNSDHQEGLLFNSGETQVLDMEKFPAKKYELKPSNSLEFNIPVVADAEEENG